MENNTVRLYKSVFPPDMMHPTLAVIGLVQPLGSLFPISEMQCRWATRVFKVNFLYLYQLLFTLCYRIYHWLTTKNDVHQFRYFLLMNMYFCLLGVRIGSHFNKNGYMHEKTTIEFCVRIVGRKNLNWCTPFFAVSQ